MSNRRKQITSFLLVAFLISPFLPAVTINIMNLPDMVERAERVFHGRCTMVENTEQEVAGIPVTQYTFVVRKAIKGTQEGETVVFRQLRSEGPRGLADVPSYSVGDELLLFLKKESRVGLTSPVGLAQGAFAVKRFPGGRIAVINSVKNRNLTAGLSLERGTSLGLTPAEYEMLGQGEAVPLETFSSVVSRLVHFKRPEDVTE
jgi:hypothetical protein